jgi:hypothetical protein
MSAREVIARAIEPDAFDQPPEFEPWAAQRRVSAYAKARKYLAALDAAIERSRFLQRSYAYDPSRTEEPPHFSPAEEMFARSGSFSER